MATCHGECDDMWNEYEDELEHLLLLGANPNGYSRLMKTQLFMLAIWFGLPRFIISLIRFGVSWETPLTIDMDPGNPLYPFQGFERLREKKVWLPIFFIIRYADLTLMEVVLDTALKKRSELFYPVFHQDESSLMIWHAMFIRDYRDTHNRILIRPEKSCVLQFFIKIHRIFYGWFKGIHMQRYIDLPCRSTLLPGNETLPECETPFQWFCMLRYTASVTRKLWTIISWMNPSWNTPTYNGLTALHFTQYNITLLNMWMKTWLEDRTYDTFHGMDVLCETTSQLNMVQMLIKECLYKEALQVYEHVINRHRKHCNLVFTPLTTGGPGTLLHRVIHSKNKEYTTLLRIMVTAYVKDALVNGDHNFTYLDMHGHTIIMSAIINNKHTLIELLAERCPHYFTATDFQLLNDRKWTGQPLNVLFPKC
jgi:hypothetical protein